MFQRHFRVAEWVTEKGGLRMGGRVEMSTSRLTAVILLLATAVSAAPARSPNLVLIVGDDHRNEAYGAYGGKLARTPNLDRMAASGARFDRAYANSPMCTPSRQSFLTGRYPHAVGVTLLRHALGEEAYTLAERLREAGYRTGAFGKMHFNSNRRHGFEVHRTPGEFRNKYGERPGDRPLPQGLDVLPAWRPFKDPARIWLNGFYRPLGRYDDEMAGTWYARQAVAFMEAHRDEPFFVQVGFHEPHSPFWFPVEFANRYDPKQMPVPTPGPEDAGQIPEVFADLAHDDKQGIIASYLTSVAFLDLNVGRVLTAIEELGLAENTLVVYLGDHGYHLGEHGRFEKHCFYERAVRAPLVVSFPGRIRPGTSSKALVEFVDIVPTVLDYLGVPFVRSEPPPHDLHGFSLRPLIEGKVGRVRDAVFSEYQHTEESMVRTERYKLIYRTSKAATDWYKPVEPPEGRGVKLFDLRADAEEMHNVATDPANAQIVSALLDRLVAWYRRNPPKNEPPPPNLSRLEFLDWAIAPRDVPATGR